jgi:hypothetical protein
MLPDRESGLAAGHALTRRWRGSAMTAAGEAFERIPASVRKVLIVALPLVLAGSCFAAIANGVDGEQVSAPR